MLRKTMAGFYVFMLAFGLMFGSFAYANANPNPTPTVSGEFPIGIFVEPPPVDVSDASFADIRAMNANFIVASNLNTTPATTDWALEKAAANGLKMLVTDTGIRWYRSEWVSQNDDDGDALSIRNDKSIGQSFRTPAQPEMAIWKLSFKKSGAWPSGKSATISIYDSPAKTTLIGTSTLNGPIVSNYPEFVINGAVVSPDTTYYMELTTNSTTDLGPFLTSVSDAYADGQAYANGTPLNNDLYFQMTLPRAGGGNWNAFSPTADLSDEYITAYVNHYKDNPAILGYNLVDEPFADVFPKLKSVSDKIKAIDPDHMVYTNLYGVCDVCQHYYSGTDDPVNGGYENYVNSWLATDPDMISFDSYPYLSTGFDEKPYYQSLEYFRKQSLLNGTDLWAYIQSMSYDYFNMIEPSESQLKFQVYSTLAYGAKGYVYFTYHTPAGMDNGLIMPDGTKNDTYDYAKEVNGEVLKLGTTLLSLTSKDVYHTGGVPPFATALPATYFWQPTPGEPEMPMIVSRFENEDGREFVMVVNKDLENAHSAHFTLSNTPASVTEVSKTTGLEVAAAYNAGTGKLTAEFEPGEGRLYALEPSAGELTASNLTIATQANSAVSGTLVANGAAGHPLTYSIVTNGTKGTAVITNAASGAFTYTPNSGASGTDTFHFKANNGLQDSNSAVVTVNIAPEPEPTAAKTTLTGEGIVQPGKKFTVRYGLSSVVGDVYAQDIKLDYDASVMEFVSAKSVQTGVKLVRTVKPSDGKLQFILASAGAGNAVSSDKELIELTFKAKPITSTASGVISITSVILGNAQGSETQGTPANITIVIGYEGDLNLDGKVTVGDLAIMSTYFNSNVNSPDWEQAKRADLNHDGVIDLQDMMVLAKKITE
ncbi:cohesin domain-containing protein [Paenibacillus mendelii]|uniref:Cohesin domain-containing protein n=1 Tax=Paenibacillus mendelii TaxID=206163 RepID=A0ABV6J2T5_9BACL|nr:cohesin domain-containing protein [Paenibacillus mendelii]MCQ6562778.1 cohesin domain-containing protein [Paenibacillus mendelii]